MLNDKMIIKNGIIVDGTGSEPYIGDILTFDGKIKSIGRKLPDSIEDCKIIDAKGRYVTPGFIDIHRHCDYAVLKDGFGTIELSQGITTVVTGSCGLSPFPLRKENKEQLGQLLSPCLGMGVRDDLFYDYKDYSAYLDKAQLPMNIGNLIGSCSVRIAVKGFEKTPFTDYEMEQAKQIVTRAMENGALGLSMGIMYTPEYYSSKEELSEIARAAANCDGVLTAHIRGEGDTLVSSIKEIISIAQNADIPLQISHFKSCGPDNWGKDIFRAIDIIEKERNSGMDLNVDFYPYTGGSTTLMSLIPPCFMRPTLNETWEFMATDKAPKELEAALNKKYDDWDNYILSLGLGRIIITSLGKTLAEMDDPYEFICKIMSKEQGKVGIIVMSMSPNDVDAVAKLPYSSVISDGLYAESGMPHPRLYAAFPKILRDFVDEREVLTLPQAIKKMTSMPAKKMKLENIGSIKENNRADISIFDLKSVRDNADFAHPTILSSGMDHVIVGGKIAWEHEKLTGNHSGKYIKKGVILS
jgi:N-acyl-D-amino-acid deacylase